MDYDIGKNDRAIQYSTVQCSAAGIFERYVCFVALFSTATSGPTFHNYIDSNRKKQMWGTRPRQQNGAPYIHVILHIVLVILQRGVSPCTTPRFDDSFFLNLTLSQQARAYLVTLSKKEQTFRLTMTKCLSTKSCIIPITHLSVFTPTYRAYRESAHHQWVIKFAYDTQHCFTRLPW